MVENTMGSNL